jgi:hypothetical protein
MHAISLSPAEIDAWLAGFERHLDALVERQTDKRIAEAMRAVIEVQRNWLTETLAEAIQRGIEITQSDLDRLPKEMAAAMRNED